MEENNRDANQNENPAWNPPQDKREQEGRPVEPQSLPYQNNGYENGAYSNNDYPLCQYHHDVRLGLQQYREEE